MSKDENTRELKGPRRYVKMDPELTKKGMKALPELFALIFKNYRLQLVLVAAGIIVTSVTTLISTLFMKTLIDDYVVPLTQAAVPDFAPLGRTLMILAAVLSAGVVCSLLYNLIMVFVSQGTMRRIRNDLFENMEKLPVSFFDTHSHGDIMSVYTNDVDTLRQLMSMTLPQFISSMFTLVSTFISMVILDIPLTLVQLVMIGFMIFAVLKVGAVSGGYFARQQKNLGAVNGYVEEMIGGQKVVKVFCREEKNLEGFRELNGQLRDSAFKANLISNIVMPLTQGVSNIGYVMLAAVGGAIALNTDIGLTVGTLAAFLNLSRSLNMPVTMIAQQASSIMMAGAGAGRIFELRDQEPESDDGDIELVNAEADENGAGLKQSGVKTGRWAWKRSDAGRDEYAELKGGVELKNVDFGYTKDKQVLFGIDLYAEPGQKIAFVGSTGAGKTTITNLLNRFYDIQGGSILFDSIDINDIRKPDLRRSLGMVLQDTHLFTGTVMENIRYGRLDASDDECIEAAKLANAHGFIRRLPEGYDTVLTGSGGNLSQGQRQLLAIARAAVADPPVLILDEATSSIDTHTELLVQRGMDALMKGRTSFVIAHRLSTVRNSDCIMVMEQGRIIERGSHERLMEKKGRYYQLYTGGSQFKFRKR